MNTILIFLGAIVVVFILLYLGFWIKALIPSPKFTPVGYIPSPIDEFPTDGFRSSTPEQQGIDSTKLLQLNEFYQKAHRKNPGVSIDSISIYRNGFNVADFCINPLYTKDDPHVIHSVTKSIMSALIGIAIEQGKITSVEVPYVDFFKDKQSAIRDERMRTVKIKDLLSMQTGIRSRDYALYHWQGIFDMQESDDWVAYIMSLPMDAEPGTRFDYSNMSSFLLSAIIQQATGMDTLTFARKNLFDPLGIQDVRWEKSPQAIHIGYARMWMKPDDMAKFGLLYLQKGKWDGKQIIPPDWIAESLTPHAFPKNLVDVLDENGDKDKQLTTIQWRGANFVRPFTDGYGYQWWLDRDGSYAAVGVSGQYIMVVPQKNLVVVVTNSSHGLGVFFPRRILDKYILPAVQSDQPLTPNPVDQQALAVFAQPPALMEEEQDLAPLPQIAQEISGNCYKLTKNRWHYDNFRLDFKAGVEYVFFSYTAKVHDKAKFRVGLNGVFQFSNTGIGKFAARGAWTSPDLFEIDVQQIGYSAPVKFKLTFIEDGLQVEEISLTGPSEYDGKKR